FPAHLFQGINTASIGNARKAVETGIIPRISTWKAGCVRLSLDISLIPENALCADKSMELDFAAQRASFCLSAWLISVSHL
ncbi:MAG TPA: hypothetical protein VIH63_13270, partial [Xanthobacteraceae bacterium]